MLFLGPSLLKMSSMGNLRPSFLHPYTTPAPTKYQKESLEATTDAWSSSKCVFRQLVLNPSKNGSPSHRISPLVRSLFTRQSSRASFSTPRHNSSPVLVVPQLSSETTCEGRRGLYPATLAAAATSEILAETSQSWYRLFTQTGSCP